MKTDQRLILLLSISLIIVACSPTTQLRKSWSDPSLANSPVEPFKKVFIMVNARNEVNRRAAEDQLVSLIKRGNAIQSYTYVTPADTSQKELVEKLIKDGFDGVITMRKKLSYKPKQKPPLTLGPHIHPGMVMDPMVTVMVSHIILANLKTILPVM